MTATPSAATAATPAPALGPVLPARLARSVAATRWLAAGSLLGLILLCLAWELALAPLRPGGTWLAIKALPLCIPLAGILKNRMYTYRWVSLVIWLYFTEGVVRGWSDAPPSQWLAWAEVVLCLLLFAACALHVRLRLRNAREAAARAEDATPLALSSQSPRHSDPRSHSPADHTPSTVD